MGALNKLRTRTYTPDQLHKVISTGNPHRDQLLHYVLTRAGALQGVSLHPTVANDIVQWVVSTGPTRGVPKATYTEVRAVYAMVDRSALPATASPAPRMQSRATAAQVRAFSNPSTSLLTGNVGTWRRH